MALRAVAALARAGLLPLNLSIVAARAHEQVIVSVSGGISDALADSPKRVL